MKVRKMWAGLAAASAVVALAAPSTVLAQTAGGSAVLMNAAGQTVGTAQLSETAAGVRVTVSARGLPAGVHGIHIHAVGTCTPPDFTSAGGHFNPTGAQHGLRNPAGAHAGDLPNMTVAANGTANYATTAARVTLGAGAASLFDADGSALVIHADPDDEMTDPTGNSGGRIACGVIVRGAAALPATGGAAPAGMGLAGAALAAAGAVGAVVARRRTPRG